MSNKSKLMAVARICCGAHPQMRTSQLLTLLAVAERPGRMQTEIAQEVGLTLAAVSRAVDVMGNTGRKGKKSSNGLGWIEAVVDPTDDRRKLVFLLPKGRDFIRMLEEEMA